MIHLKRLTLLVILPQRRRTDQVYQVRLSLITSQYQTLTISACLMCLLCFRVWAPWPKTRMILCTCSRFNHRRAEPLSGSQSTFQSCSRFLTLPGVLCPTDSVFLQYPCSNELTSLVYSRIRGKIHIKPNLIEEQTYWSHLCCPELCTNFNILVFTND